MPKPSKLHYTNTGIIALIFLAVGFGLMPVLARYLGQGLGLFEQWYLRYAVASVVVIIVFWHQVRWNKFLHLPAREWGVLSFRIASGQVVGLSLFTLASLKAGAGIVSFMQVLPIIPLLGVIVFHEHLTRQKVAVTLLAFIGAALVVVTDIHSLVHLNTGALLSLLSAVFYSAMLVTRKWHKELNNHEITLAFMVFSCLCAYAISVAFDHRWIIPSGHWHTSFVLVAVAAGMLSVLVNFLISYSFEHVSAIIAGNILSLEEVFGALFGFIFYRQLLDTREVVGGLVILASVVLMNFAIRKEDKSTGELIEAVE
jgi:drug/metabolite transporter (DMT)-like permease